MPQPMAAEDALAIDEISVMVHELTGDFGRSTRSDVSEIFSPGRFSEMCGVFDLLPGSAFDLRSGFDLTTASGQEECWRQLVREQPEVVIGSPPCAAFSVLRGLAKMEPEALRERWRLGCAHLKFCIGVYRWQLSRGKHFLHEHPWGASSWRLEMMESLLSQEGLYLACGDQCAFGQTAWHRNERGQWEKRLARKRTGWLTSMRELAVVLSRKCNGQHLHASMIGGTARPTERYPPRLVRAILRTIRNRLRSDRGVAVNALEVGIGPHVDEEPLDVLNIRDVVIDAIGPSHAESFFDQYTGLELEGNHVRTARQDELSFAESLQAWEVRPKSEALHRMGRQPYGTRWIDCNKGDAARPEYRSRLVVQETRKSSTIPLDDIASVTSSTPPLEVIRLFCSLCMSLKGKNGEPLVMSFLDISRAHPHADVLRDNIYIAAPKEMGLAEDQCLLLRKCWYGTRDAGQGFEFKVRECFVKYDFDPGSFSTCVYRHKVKLLMYLVHGDDYVGLGTRSDLQWYHNQLQQHLIVKDRGTLGPGPKDVRQIRILNRVVSYVEPKGREPEMILYEADERHVELLLKAYGLKDGSKSKAIPWDKTDHQSRHPLMGKEMSDDEEVRAFRSNCMRHLFLALDRPDIQYIAKEVSRAMSSPTIFANETLKSSVRYLHGHRRLVWRYPRQDVPLKIVGLSDSNWAGCPVTRKSTTCSHLMFGKHPIFAGSSTQSIISLSSGEAEFYGSVKTACRLLGLKSLLMDLKMQLEADLCTDSSAAKGMASRRGAGSVRHIHCPALWLQQAIALRRLRITKRDGKSLSADVGTKSGIPAQKFFSLLAGFGVHLMGGRSTAQLNIASS